MNTATIAAVATPMGQGGIGIIKISGSDAISVVSSIFRFSGSKSKNSGNSQKRLEISKLSRKIYFGFIVNPETNQYIDEVLILIMPGPSSYTREDVVEIHTHGGGTVLNTVFAMVLDKGARLAEPGEFTKRAFLNGRIDLTQAEAVMDIIKARSTTALNMAANQALGHLKRPIETIIEQLRAVLIEGEAAVDFPDDVGEIFDPKIILTKLDKGVLASLEKLIDQFSKTQVLRTGIKAVIIGRPNVGKSSLMNCLLQIDRVIVSDKPGTTRDAIEASRFIHNLEIVFTDTAGIHQTPDEIENIGIQKTYDNIHKADLVLFVMDLKQGITLSDRRVFNSIENEKILIVLNKVDLIGNEDDIELYEEMLKVPSVQISAKYSIGLDDLENKIIKTLLSENDQGLEPMPVAPNIRHHQLLKKAYTATKAGLDAIKGGLTAEFCVIDLKEAIEALEEILGVSVKTDTLNSIFEQFCIGK